MTASGKHTNRKILVVEWQSGKTKIEKKEAFAIRSNEMFSWPRLFFLAFLLALRFSIISFYFIVNRTNCCAIILHEIEQRNKRQQRRMKKKMSEFVHCKIQSFGSHFTITIDFYGNRNIRNDVVVVFRIVMQMKQIKRKTKIKCNVNACRQK